MNWGYRLIKCLWMGSSTLLGFITSLRQMVFGENMRVSLSPCVRSYKLTSAVDYVVFATANVQLEENPNEVSDTRYVSKEELEELFQDSCMFPSSTQRMAALMVSTALTFTPWFKLIAKSFLYKWWDTLMARTQAPSLLEGTNAAATSHPNGKTVDSSKTLGPADVSESDAVADVEALRGLITEKDKNEILRF